MNAKIKYKFEGKVWQHTSPGGWYFVSFPTKLAKEIRANLKWQEEGWGRLKASAKTGESSWETAIWFDTKKNTYLLPLKAAIRIKEHIEVDQQIEVSVWI